MSRPAPALRRLCGGAGVALLLSVVAACGGSSSDGASSSATSSSSTSASESTTTTTNSPALLVLVTNDDGIGAPGIDAVVEALRQRPGLTVRVVAPATNQSGTGSSTSPTPPAVADGRTASGFAGTAVQGFPADAVNWALTSAGLPKPPDLVISGSNNGQNLGTISKLSGTVGAAKAAAARGIPALALSQGLGSPPNFIAGVAIMNLWLDRHLGDLAAADGDPAANKVVSINIPTCLKGSVRGLIPVPTKTTDDERVLATADCTSTAGAGPTDVDAFAVGFATESVIGP